MCDLTINIYGGNNQILPNATEAALLLDHAAVLAPLGHQFRMRARLTNAAPFDDHNEVGAGDRAEAVGDDETRAALHERR